MIERYLRPSYQRVIADPLAKWMRGISPLHITYLSCLTGVVSSFFIAFQFPILAVIFLLMSGILDTLDGTIARLVNKTSDTGSALDIISDRIVEFSIISGLFFVDPENRSMLALYMLGSCYLCITCFLVVGIFKTNQSHKNFHYSPGLIERAEAFIFFIAMIIWPEFFSLLAFSFIGLVLLTSYLHIRQFVKFKKDGML